MKIKDHFLTGEEFEIRETEIKGIFKTYPVPENLGKYYESKEYISHHQDSSSLKEKLYKFLQKFNLQYKKEILMRELSVLSTTCVDYTEEKKSARILDYGCGAGEFLKFIESDFTTFGFEPSEAARNFASKKLHTTTLLSSLDQVENESLDIITLWHVFEHIENQEEILQVFYQKLKPNAKLIIAVPNHTSDDGKRYQEFWAAYDVPRHLFHFSKSGMEILMNNDFWKLKKIKPLWLDAYYISMISEKYKKNPLFWLYGCIFGTISNFKAYFSGEFSSLIYIIEKK